MWLIMSDPLSVKGTYTIHTFPPIQVSECLSFTLRLQSPRIENHAVRQAVRPEPPSSAGQEGRGHQPSGSLWRW